MTPRQFRKLFNVKNEDTVVVKTDFDSHKSNSVFITTTKTQLSLE